MILSHIKQCDVVHVNGIFTFPVALGAYMANCLRKPYLIAPHGGLLPPTFFKKRFKKLIAYHLYVKICLSKANCIHATSPVEADICRKSGFTSHIVTIPNGIDLNEFKDIKPLNSFRVPWEKRIKGKEIVLFLGRISPEKGIDLLINAWPRVLSHSSNALLVIAGSSPDFFGSRIQKKVRNSNLNDSIMFIGNVNNDIKKSLLSEAELLILPSYSESFGNVILESMACKTPVITTHGTPWESVEKVGCGLWIPPRSDHMSKAIIHMLSIGKKSRQIMGAKGYLFAARHFDWSQIAMRFVETYECLLQKRKVVNRKPQ